MTFRNITHSPAEVNRSSKENKSSHIETLINVLSERIHTWTGYKTAIFRVLYEQFIKTGQVYLSRATIAKMAQCKDVKTVDRAVKEFESLFLIKVVRVHRHPNRYKFKSFFRNRKLWAMIVGVTTNLFFVSSLLSFSPSNSTDSEHATPINIILDISSLKKKYKKNSERVSNTRNSNNEEREYSFLRNNEASRAREEASCNLNVQRCSGIRISNKNQVPLIKKGFKEHEAWNMNLFSNKSGSQGSHSSIADEMVEMGKRADRKDAERRRFHGKKIEKVLSIDEETKKRRTQFRNEILWPISNLLGNHVHESGVITLSQFPIEIIRYAVNFGPYKEFKGGCHEAFSLLFSECRYLCRKHGIKANTKIVSEMRDIFDVKSYTPPTIESVPYKRKSVEVRHHYNPSERMEEHDRKILKKRKAKEEEASEEEPILSPLMAFVVEKLRLNPKFKEKSTKSIIERIKGR